MLVTLNNCNITNFTNKTTPSEDLDDFYKVLLDGIIDNIESLVQYGNYYDINMANITTIIYYVGTYLS